MRRSPPLASAIFIFVSLGAASCSGGGSGDDNGAPTTDVGVVDDSNVTSETGDDAPPIALDSAAGSTDSGADVSAPTETSTPPTDSTTPPTDTKPPPPPVDSGPATGKAAALATKLRGKHNFLIGLGTDDDQGFKQSIPIDIHYQYLVGDWPTWNTDAAGQGAFVTLFANNADAHGATPMFTLYQMADNGDGNISVTKDDTFMTSYWSRVKLMFQRLKTFGKPVIVQIEPDFWGYAFNGTPHDGSGVVKVSAHVSECAGLPDTFAGMSKCILKLRDAYAPKAVVGLHLTNWGFTVADLMSFYKAVGASDMDFVTHDVLDRDAGCFEVHTQADCMRSGSGWYWDESNTKSPNFHEHLALVKQYTTALGVPLLWWQMPLGVPSGSPGSTDHYRDNRVHYLFAHLDEFVAAGGVGAVFGVGAKGQTTLLTDGGQFKTAATAYFAHPVSLP